MILKLKIDVTKIDKSRLFTGSKGTYLDATVLIKDAPDQYGNDGMIVQDVTKESVKQGHGERSSAMPSGWAQTAQVVLLLQSVTTLALHTTRPTLHSAGAKTSRFK